MRILVTGATGFVGSRLLSRLAVECDQLRIFRREGSSTDNIKNIRYEEVIGDITNFNDVLEAVKGCDIVFHLAASVSYWDKFNQEQYDINVNGTRNVAEACWRCGTKRLIHTSSIVAIGMGADGEPADETTVYNMSHLRINYAETKHLAELEVQKCVAKGLDAVIVNPGAIFGPADLRRFNGSLYGGKVWQHIFYVGGGIATVDVDDVVEGMIHAWKHGVTGERYILANENRTFKEISTLIGTFLKWPKPIIRVPTWAVFALAYVATGISWLTGRRPFATVPMARFTRVSLFYSNEKARYALGMQFKPLRESIENAVEWFKSNGYLD